MAINRTTPGAPYPRMWLGREGVTKQNDANIGGVTTRVRRSTKGNMTGGFVADRPGGSPIATQCTLPDSGRTHWGNARSEGAQGILAGVIRRTVIGSRCWFSTVEVGSSTVSLSHRLPRREVVRS